MESFWMAPICLFEQKLYMSKFRHAQLSTHFWVKDHSQAINPLYK